MSLESRSYTSNCHARKPPNMDSNTEMQTEFVSVSESAVQSPTYYDVIDENESATSSNDGSFVKMLDFNWS